MKKKVVRSLLLILLLGAVGYVFTEEKAQNVQKINSDNVIVRNFGNETVELNPLQEETDSEIARAVREHYAELGEKANFVESYDDVKVYTKKGQEQDSYIVFARYEMKIKDIYTKVPGLGTFYVTKDETGGTYEVSAQTEDEKVKAYIGRLTAHSDVQALFNEINAEYTAAVQSDALLKEALADLKNAYEDSTGS